MNKFKKLLSIFKRKDIIYDNDYFMNAIWKNGDEYEANYKGAIKLWKDRYETFEEFEKGMMRDDPFFYGLRDFVKIYW